MNELPGQPIETTLDRRVEPAVVGNNCPDLSVVMACRNEEANVEAIAAEVITQLEPLGISFDIIFIDNGSQDRTVELVRGLCARDSRIRLIVNTRNFGQMRSPTHGIYSAGGRAVVSMCSDFQDSPALLPEFVRRWKAGVPIVLGLSLIHI